jgi:ABC-type antimicrobial peptide transport system permease subunit
MKIIVIVAIIVLFTVIFFVPIVCYMIKIDREYERLFSKYCSSSLSPLEEKRYQSLDKQISFFFIGLPAILSIISIIIVSLIVIYRLLKLKG